jgi:acetylornithine deacetylase
MREEKMVTTEQKKVLECIDEDFVVKFAMELTDIFSPTGEERPASEFVYRKMLSMGLRARLQEISETQANALGELCGTGGGYTLMFNGHMDISYTGKETYVPGGEYTMFRESVGTTGFSTEPSVIEDGWIKGNGVRNMKSAMAAYLGAVNAIMKSGVSLKGDILVAAVAGEIEKSNVDDFRGRWLDGYGSGTRYLVLHGGVADMCIIGEPSFLEISRGNMGPVWVKISIRGDFTHTAWCDRVVNPIDRTVNLSQAIRKWIPDYQKRHMYLNTKPQVNLGAIQGGWPWRLSRTPGYCSLYLDVRIIPGQSPLDVKEELNELIRELKRSDPDMDIEMEILVTDPPTIIEEDELVVQAVKSAHNNIFGKPPKEHFDVPVADATHLNRYGIPTLTYGPAGRNPPGKEEYGYGWQNIEDLMQCTQVYALTALDICSRTRNQKRKGG